MSSQGGLLIKHILVKGGCVKMQTSYVHDPFPQEYYDDLRSFVYDEAMNAGSGVKIVYSAMHGVGADFLDRAFKVAGLSPVVHVKKQRGS